MKTTIKNNLLVLCLTIMFAASITFSCYALDQKLSACYACPDYEMLSIFENYPWEPLGAGHLFY